MIRSRRSAWVLAAAVLTASLAWPAHAHAADKRTEAAANVAIDKASQDYAQQDYERAQVRLQKALRACGANRCAPTTKAALLRDVGTMQLKNGDREAALRSFEQAVHLAPDLTLNPSYDSRELQAAWREAGGKLRPGPTPTGAQPTGDFAHTPPAAQKVNTPLPIYASGVDAEVRRVVLRYRGEDMEDWRRIEMKKVAGGWAAYIPCDAVTRGTVHYFLMGFDANGDPVANSGDQKHPFTVRVEDEIEGEAPHLPDEPAPRSCDESGEEPPPPHGEEGEGHAAGPTGPPRSARVWAGVSGTFDIVQLPQGTDLCKLNQSAGPANSSGYVCTNPDGSDFPNRSSSTQNDALVQGQSGNLPGGMSIGTIHVMLAVDVAITENFLAGGRLGWVFGGYPGQAGVSDGRAFGPRFHLEARATYVFGTDPLAHEGFAPLVFAGGGAAEFDAHGDASVTMQNIAGNQPVSIWRTAGPAFVMAGGGVRYGFSGRFGFTMAGRVNLAFGASGMLPSFGPELTLQYGF